MIPSPGPKPVSVFGSSGGGSFTPISSGEANTDGNSEDVDGLIALAYWYGFNGASWDRVRIADIYSTVVATIEGATVVWTPGAGNFFRLMGYTISVSGTAAATGPIQIELLDGAAPFANHFATVAETTASGDTQIGVDLGQGYVSAAAANTLSINLSAALLTGGAAINAWGTVETAG